MLTIIRPIITTHSEFPGTGGEGRPRRYHAENIILLSFNRLDSLEWSNVIPKSQFDDQSDGLISHQVMNTGGELHFLFNII